MPFFYKYWYSKLSVQYFVISIIFFIIFSSFSNSSGSQYLYRQCLLSFKFYAAVSKSYKHFSLRSLRLSIISCSVDYNRKEYNDNAATQELLLHFAIFKNVNRTYVFWKIVVQYFSAFATINS